MPENQPDARNAETPARPAVESGASIPVLEYRSGADLPKKWVAIASTILSVGAAVFVAFGALATCVLVVGIPRIQLGGVLILLAIAGSSFSLGAAMARIARNLVKPRPVEDGRNDSVDEHNSSHSS